MAKPKGSAIVACVLSAAVAFGAGTYYGQKVTMDTVADEREKASRSTTTSSASSSQFSSHYSGTRHITEEITGSLDTETYWTPGGKSYHFDRSCRSLKNSTSISSGTLQDALDAGKTDPCDFCAGG